MVRIWSQPTPVWRSAMARHSTADGGVASDRRSSTTKSLPAPCILLNRRPAAGSTIAVGVVPVIGGGLGGRVDRIGFERGIEGGLLGRRRVRDVGLDRYGIGRGHRRFLL